MSKLTYSISKKPYDTTSNNFLFCSKTTVEKLTRFYLIKKSIISTLGSMNYYEKAIERFFVKLFFLNTRAINFGINLLAARPSF